MKTLSHTTLTFGIAMLALSFSTAAQTVYRCGNEYTQKPCDNGSAVRVDDTRSESDRKAHEAAVKKEQRVADTMERQRLSEERAAHSAAVRAAAQEDQAAREAAQREARQAAQKKKASQPVKIKAYGAPKANPSSK